MDNSNHIQLPGTTPTHGSSATLRDAALTVQNCANCPWASPEPGEGPEDAEVMFIAEGPGVQEDRQGHPCVGPAGKLLDKLLPTAGLRRDRVFIANIIRCRTPDNRDPAPTETAACAHHLDRQVEIINPTLIVPLGKFALARFFPGENISQARGKLRQTGGRHVYPIMHPAASLRRQETRRLVIKDFREIPRILERIHRLPKQPGPPGRMPARQPNLF